MLRALPFKTFGEIAVLGRGVEIHCPSCYRVTKIDPADERLRDRPFAVTRFRCTGMRDFGSAHALRPCEQLGHIHITPSDTDRIRPGRSIPWCSISRPRCVPVWRIDQAPKHLPPWKVIWAHRSARLACPTCRAVLNTVWRGGDGIPFTDGYDRRPTGAGRPR
jgi:hypothetical protein